ncbi:hypothetical protein CDEF62S_01283 [Castellaniella defragrans]
MRPGVSRFPWLKATAACAALSLHAAVLAMVLSSKVVTVSLGQPEALDVQFVELGPATEPDSAGAAAPAESEAQADSQPQSELQPQPDPEPQVDPEPQPRADPQPVSEPQAEPEPQPVPEPPAEPPEPDAVTEPPPPLKPEPKPEPAPELRPEPKPEPPPKVRHEPKPKPKLAPHPKPHPRPQSAPSPQPARPAHPPAAPASPSSAAAPQSSAAAGGAPKAAQARGEQTAQDPDRPRTVGRVDYLGARPRPVYPRISERRGEQGRVVLRVLISPQGEVADVKVQRSSGYSRLDEAAIDAMRHARFRPYTENGIAYKALVDIPFDFVL